MALTQHHLAHSVIWSHPNPKPFAWLKRSENRKRENKKKQKLGRFWSLLLLGCGEKIGRKEKNRCGAHQKVLSTFGEKTREKERFNLKLQFYPFSLSTCYKDQRVISYYYISFLPTFLSNEAREKCFQFSFFSFSLHTSNRRTKISLYSLLFIFFSSIFSFHPSKGGFLTKVPSFYNQFAKLLLISNNFPVCSAFCHAGRRKLFFIWLKWLWRILN